MPGRTLPASSGVLGQAGVVVGGSSVVVGGVLLS